MTDEYAGCGKTSNRDSFIVHISEQQNFGVA